MTDEPTRISRVVAAAAKAGLAIEVRRFPAGTRTALDAARAIGCSVDQIVKSLVFIADGSPVVALVSGADRVDPARLAAAIGATEVRRASGEEARAATGYAIGGVPPFGHDRTVPVVLDTRLFSMDPVWAAAGGPDAVFATTADDLQQAAGARVAAIADAGGSPSGPLTADPVAG